jgi:hypothetical protein
MNPNEIETKSELNENLLEKYFPDKIVAQFYNGQKVDFRIGPQTFCGGEVVSTTAVGRENHIYYNILDPERQNLHKMVSEENVDLWGNDFRVYSESADEV